MHLRYRSVLPLVAVCLALAIAPAFAAKPQPNKLTQSGAPIESHINSITTTCELGVDPLSNPPAGAFGYILPPDDEYYQLIDPAQCAGCDAAGVLLSNAHVLLYFTAPCQIPVTVAVLPAIVLAPGCLAPNPFAAPICPPATYTINDGGFANECVDYQFPIPSGCCLVGPAFLEIRFDQGTCPTSRPAFCAAATCNNCTQYNYYPGAAFPGDDLCAILSPFGIGAINMWADATCCGNTPTLPGSWGKLKTLYR